ncbi:hypothetical protein Nepgr_030618 [Nepenthes gracilis]|uniref:Uncharacterized protein n=1 Tax=Nepenthes gracilis TaxID=150966 RepID=A0AAD3TEX8_NEPGR|nr:hypothetical protein Nepgr_030618 [Nepenthes gracilis]
MTSNSRDPARDVLMVSIALVTPAVGPTSSVSMIASNIPMAISATSLAPSALLPLPTPRLGPQPTSPHGGPPRRHRKKGPKWTTRLETRTDGAEGSPPTAGVTTQGEWLKDSKRVRALLYEELPTCLNLFRQPGPHLWRSRMMNLFTWLTGDKVLI